MSILNWKTAGLAIVAGIGLSGCAYGPYGGLGVGYGNGYYDPYYSGRYYSGYGYPYGYSRYSSRYGYGWPYYYGWNDGFYYPGTGYYVYDRYRRPHRWSDAQRRYWERQRGIATSSGGVARVVENWADFQNGPRASTNVVRQRSIDTGRSFRNREIATQQRMNAERARARVEAQQLRTERQQVRTTQNQERRTARAEARQERKATRGSNRRADRD